MPSTSGSRRSSGGGQVRARKGTNKSIRGIGRGGGVGRAGLPIIAKWAQWASTQTGLGVEEELLVVGELRDHIPAGRLPIGEGDHAPPAPDTFFSPAGSAHNRDQAGFFLSSGVRGGVRLSPTHPGSGVPRGGGTRQFLGGKGVSWEAKDWGGGWGEKN